MMKSFRSTSVTFMFLLFSTLIPIGAVVLTSAHNALAAAADFTPANPFYSPSTLPFQAPPFDKIKDADYQPAIEAGMAQQLEEVGDRRQSGAADLRKHHRRDGEEWASAEPGPPSSTASSVPTPIRHAAEDRGRSRRQSSRRIAGRDSPQHEALRAHRDDLQAAAKLNLQPEALRLVE